ncbi:probable ATP-dependent RNA helicase kurz isoform X2 [Apis laboriosa]|uniref:probable ATP-dependent RNA helicase kurz isoform X2 n=1 Tax=Apis laboriosa TaxID=183418 RepID=UPI001CC43AF7|nr:probable ATP-dependent RNA helicase kurz isoform X2 [Apis laboriosa]
MGKKKYNWKARNNIEVIIDNSVTKKIPIDIIHREDNFDSCNALVLPNEKRKTKKKIKNTVITRLLSKKRRKQLEKVIEKKKKKLQRTELLKELVEVQASPEELKQYVSLTSVQTKGLKRHFREAELSVKEYKIDSNIKNKNDTIEMPINAIRASKKKRLAILEKEVIEKTISDLNVIGFDESSNSELESDTKNNEDEQKEDATNIVSLEKNKIKEKNEHISNKKNDLIDGNVTKNTIEEEKKSIVTLTKKSLKPQQLIEKKSALFVMLQRKPEIQAARLKLPIVAEEQIIMEVINENPVVIITGETGSGKTTQVPQFLYEAGYAQEKLIGITEPRRVAAISMSKRVAQEMNLSEKEVSYLIRFEGNVTPETKIKFMTDGVLLKEIQNDFLLTKYSIIILDEAHERSVYTDILIGLLSRIVPLRNKRKNSLKLVIMSATLRVEEFVENNKLFKMKPPVLTVESRQFPVTIHFNKTTSINYISDALKKAIKIHTRLPDGGILIFLTGQREVNFVVRKLRQAFSTRNKKEITKKIEKSENKDFSKKKEDIQDKNDNNKNDNIDSDNDFCYKKAIRYNKLRQKKHIQLPNINLDDYSVIPIDDTYEDLIAAEDDEEEQLDESEDEDMINPKICINAQPLWVLPLYSLLPSHKQARVFEPPPEGHRLCVVSTNVAETSLTIPNIKYVIDCGRCKIKMYDKVTGVNTYKVYYTSKASANQRAGRAGRTGPGHCYRLYSSAMFNDHFEQFSQSEIQRKPVDDLILQMKIMNIDKVVNFPFPTPPDATQLKMAEKRLIILGILEQPAIEKKDLYSAKVTSLGRSIAAFPVAPRYGKMLALSHQHNLLQYTVCMVAALSVQEIFMETFDIDVDSRNKWLQIKRFWAGTGNSLLLGDLMVLIRAVGSAEYAGTKGKLFSFCEEHGLRHKAIVEIRKLRQQLTNEINLNIQDLNLIIDPQMKPPVDMEAKLLRQIVLAGMADQVAKKVMPDEINEDQDKTKWKYAYKTVDMEDPVFLHSSCVLRKICPEWVVYQEIYETNKMYMRGVTAIESEWLPKFAPSLCQLGDPLTNPPPRYDPETGKIMCSITGTFGRAEGKVFPKLKQFVSSLLSTPQSITKAWAKLIPRTQEMTQLLLSHGIMSKVQLLETWKADRNFLLSAYQKWLPESMHGHIMIIWPPI